ncbi:MAG: cyclic nucleotide-binding domain-containing protein [Capsulimonadales bacterium]|nr:cyclic nucleotide-binding domain-containing protein [Capsulimonadales bacterium]
MSTQTIAQENENSVAPKTAGDVLQAIRRYPEFAKLPTGIQENLASLVEIERHPANSTIFRFNDPGNAMYFLCEGSIRFVTHDYTGREVVLEEIRQGDVFGEVALYSEGARTADAVATSDVVLLLLRREKMNEFLRSCPEVSGYLLRRMASRLTSSNRMLRNTSMKVEEVVASERSFFDRIVKKIVDVFGTFPSFLIHIFVIVLWIVLKRLFNSPFLRFESQDLLILSLVINVEGFAVSMLILVNQARESKEEGVRDRTEFEATVHTDNSIRFLHEKVDALAAEVRRVHDDLYLRSGDKGRPAPRDSGRNASP